MPEALNIQQNNSAVAAIQLAADAMFAYLRDVLYDPRNAKLDVESLPVEFQDLGAGLLFVGTNITESRDLANAIAKGNLNSGTVSSENEFASGLKNLQSTLKHITWQVGQVAKGDYQQRLKFAGEFSESINDMIDQLRERDDALRSEIARSQKFAEELQANVDFFETIAANMTQWIVVFDKDTKELLYSNHEARDVLLDSSHVELARSFSQQLIDVEYQTGDYISVDSESNFPGVLDASPQTGTARILELPGSDDGLDQYFTGIAYPLTWRERQAIVFVFTDVTDQQHEREELENVAYFDALTGTYSRHYGMQLLDKWLAAREQFILAFVDMDSLKYVNDTFGHNAGDEYIMTVCRLLKNFDSKAKICRLGGDEFMLLCKGWQLENSERRLEYLRDELIAKSGLDYKMSVSYGVVVADADNTKSGSLMLSIADEIMYKYKRSRKMERRSEV